MQMIVRILESEGGMFLGFKRTSAAPKVFWTSPTGHGPNSRWHQQFHAPVLPTAAHSATGLQCPFAAMERPFEQLEDHLFTVS